jgi:hypothetical protein
MQSLLSIASSFALGGTSPARQVAHGEDRLVAEVVEALLRELAASQLGSIAFAVVQWTFLGMLGGVVLAVAGFFVLRALGGYGWKWKHAVWFRVLTFVLMLLLCPILLGAAGCAQGQYRAAEIAVRDTQIGTKLLPQVGAFGADLLAALYVNAPKVGQGEGLDEVWPQAELERFRKGQWQLDTDDLPVRVGKLTEKATGSLSGQLKAAALKAMPDWKGGLGEKALDWSLPALVRGAEGKGREQLDKLGVRPFLDDLKTAARASGGKMTHEQLTTFMTQQVLVPAMLRPIRDVVRGTQTAMLIGSALVLLLPVGFFRLAEFIRSRRAAEPIPQVIPVARAPTADPRKGSPPPAQSGGEPGGS